MGVYGLRRNQTPCPLQLLESLENHLFSTQKTKTYLERIWAYLGISPRIWATFAKGKPSDTAKKSRIWAIFTPRYAQIRGDTPRYAPDTRPFRARIPCRMSRIPSPKHTKNRCRFSSGPAARLPCARAVKLSHARPWRKRRSCG